MISLITAPRDELRVDRNGVGAISPQLIVAARFELTGSTTWAQYPGHILQHNLG